MTVAWPMLGSDGDADARRRKWQQLAESSRNARSKTNSGQCRRGERLGRAPTSQSAYESFARKWTTSRVAPMPRFLSCALQRRADPLVGARFSAES